MAQKFKIFADFVVGSKSMQDIIDGLDRGLDGAAKDFSKTMKERVAEGMSSGMRFALASGRSGDAVRKFMETNIIDSAEKFQKMMREGNVAEAARIKQTLDNRVAAFEREIRAQTDAFESVSKRQARTFAESSDAFAESIGRVHSDLSSPEGLTGLGRRLAERIQERGRSEQSRAASIRGVDPTQAQAAAALGKGVAMIGGALVGVAAVAAAVMALIKVFMDLNDKIVDMNKAIVATAGVADFGFGGRATEAGHKFNTELTTMRTSILDAASRVDGFRVSAEDMFRVLGGLNEANYRFETLREEIGRGDKNLRSYADAANLAITYSKLFGVDMQQVSTNMGTLANDFGVGLTTIAEGLSEVHREAALSGFSVKRFYSTIMEATSGMGFYAVRLEEAGQMLKFLSNMMGETAGEELFKTLTNTWTDATTEQRLTDILTRGPEVAKIFEDVAAGESDAIFKALGDKLGPDRMKELGLGSGADLAKVVGGKDEAGRQMMMARMKAAGVDPELIQRLDNLVETVKAGQGDLASQVDALGRVGPAATMAMLTQSKVFGGRMLHQFVAEEGVAGRASAEQLTGRSGKGLDALIDASRATAADMVALRKVQKQVQDEGRVLSKEEQKAMAALYGATVTQTGEIVGATVDSKSNSVLLGNQITDEQGLMLAQNDRYAKAEEQAVSEDIQLARQISQNTEKLSNVMEANISAILNRIWKAVQGFWNDFLGWWGTTDVGIEGRQKVESAILTEQNKVTRVMEENAKNIQLLGRRMEEEKDPILRQGIEAQKKILEGTQLELSNLSTALDLGADTLREMETKGMTAGMITTLLNTKLQDQGFSLGSASASKAYEKMEGLAKGGKDTKGRTEIGTIAVQQGVEAAAEAYAKEVAFAGGFTHPELIERAKTMAKDSGMSWQELQPLLAEMLGRELQKTEKESSDLFFIQKKSADALDAIAADTAQSLKVQEDQKNISILDTVQKAGDLIIPAKGRPIMTDPADTVMAMKPGGPIAAGLSGGGGGVVVNIHGGDTKVIYDTVMRALKATGNA